MKQTWALFNFQTTLRPACYCAWVVSVDCNSIPFFLFLFLYLPVSKPGHSTQPHKQLQVCKLPRRLCCLKARLDCLLLWQKIIVMLLPWCWRQSGYGYNYDNGGGGGDNGNDGDDDDDDNDDQTRYLQIQSQNVPLQKASVLRTATVRSTRVLGKTDGFLYI